MAETQTTLPGTVVRKYGPGLKLIGNVLQVDPTTLSGFILDPGGAVQGDLLYFNGAAWVLLAPGTAGNVLTTHGASANPTWAPAATGPIVTTYDFASGAQGWTATNGSAGGSAAITTVAHLTVPASTNAALDAGGLPGSWIGPRVEKALPQTGGGYRIEARLAAYTNAASFHRATLAAHIGAVAGAPGSAVLVAATIRDTGALEVIVDSGSPALTVSGAALSAGTAWVAIECAGGRASVYYGTGIGTAPPVTWSFAAAYYRATGPCEITAMLGAAVYGGGSGSQLTVDWNNVSVYSL